MFGIVDLIHYLEGREKDLGKNSLPNRRTFDNILTASNFCRKIVQIRFEQKNEITDSAHCYLLPIFRIKM